MIEDNLAFEDESPLLKHELAYVLGQIKCRTALPILYKILEDLDEHPMVRHEAGEAIGAIGDLNSLPKLQKHLSDKEISVRETCDLAINRIIYENQLNNKDGNSAVVERGSRYYSIDPAPPEEVENEDFSTLKNNLIDGSLPLFKRYRAMFSLRNIGDEKAVLALGNGFTEKNSALFRHEIAYVFGQLRHEASVPFLKRVIDDLNEESMVRHECAEALGSIGTEEALSILKAHINDRCDIVSQSCIVGLGIAECD